MLDPYFFKEAIFFCMVEPLGGTLILSHIRRLRPFFRVQNSEFQYFWGFQKDKYFFGYYEDFVDILGGGGGGHHKIGLVLG